MSNTNSALEIIQELRDAKTEIASNLTDVKVIVNGNGYPDILAAISGLFGESYVNNNSAVITFEMMVECIRLVRLAGTAKAQELIK